MLASTRLARPVLAAGGRKVGDQAAKAGRRHPAERPGGWG